MSDRERLVEAMRLLQERGLNASTSGNVSVRSAAGMLVSPSAVAPAELTGASIVELDPDGTALSPGIPTTEWRIHRDIYAAFPEANAIVHAHSPHATALASLREDLPAFHYQVALAGGDAIRCASYALYGTQELSDAVIAALGDRRACLMANHGMVAHGPTLAKALSLAMLVEVLCQQYLLARGVGSPVILSADEVAAALDSFSRYGQPEQPGQSGS